MLRGGGDAVCVQSGERAAAGECHGVAYGAAELMALSGFQARNHPQQTGKRGPVPHVDDRGTDPRLFEKLHQRFNFTIDVAASAENAMLPRYYTVEQNGLARSWAHERVWANPPYSDIAPWVRKGHEETDAEIIVMLLPANRTEQKWWQEWVEPFRDRVDRRLRVEFLAGRQRFVAPGAKEIGPNERPPFGCCLLIWE